MCQSSNDTFPTAMHVATVQMLDDLLLPQIDALAAAIEAKAEAWMDIVKIGRTHLEDAVPLTVGQEWSGYAHQLRDAMRDIEAQRAAACTNSPQAALRSAPASPRRAASARRSPPGSPR